MKYELFALRSTDENMSRILSNRFSRVTPKYALVYTNKDAAENAVPIRNEDIRRLTKADEQWLLECNVRIIAEETKKSIHENGNKLNVMVDNLESALAEEAKKVSGG